MDPKVVGLDLNAFEKSATAIQEKGLDLTVKGRSAKGTVTATKDQVVLTTIPFDKGWKAYVDGKKVPVQSFKNAFVGFPISAGEHTIKLVYLPEGLIIGVLLFIFCTSGFALYVTVTKKPKLSSLPEKKNGRSNNRKRKRRAI